MSFLTTYILDSALAKFTSEANRLDICSQQPLNYEQATSTYSLGNKTGIEVSSPSPRTPNGRKVVISSIADGIVTKNGTAKYWAITDSTNSRLLATGEMPEQSVSNGNQFKTQAFDIGIPSEAL